MKKVGIVLVNYKDYVNRYLAECQTSIEGQTYDSQFVNVYIVDNATSQESRLFISKAYPTAKILPRYDGNYAAANNVGIKQALLDDCEYVVIANMDTKFGKDWLNELVKAAENDSQIGVVQSKIFLYPETEAEWKQPKINSVGNKLHYLGFGFTDGYGEVDRPNDSGITVKEIPGYASGCSFLIKKQVLEKIIGYDEELYMYHDDIDVSLKVRLAGYKIVLATKSIVYHKYEFSRSVRMFYFMERNRYLIMLIYYKWLTLLLLFPIMIVMDLGLLFFSVLNNTFYSKLNFYFYFLRPKNWKYIFERRKQVHKKRALSDGELFAKLVGRLDFMEINNPLLKWVGNPITDLYFKFMKFIIIW